MKGVPVILISMEFDVEDISMVLEPTVVTHVSEHCNTKSAAISSVLWEACLLYGTLLTQEVPLKLSVGVVKYSPSTTIELIFC